MADGPEAGKQDIPRRFVTAEFVQVRNQSMAALLILLVGFFLWLSWSMSTKKRHPGMSESGYVVDLNRATLAELNLLPGIGPKLAEEILKKRESQGSFQSIDDISAIRGLKGARFSNLKKYIVVSPVR